LYSDSHRNLLGAMNLNAEKISEEDDDESMSTGCKMQEPLP
jgi:hypothetical protein